MNAKRVTAAAGVILAAQKTHQTAAGIAAALEASGLLQSPESADELVELRSLVTEFAATVDQRTERLLDVQRLLRKWYAEAKGREKYGNRLKAENKALLSRQAGERP